MLCSIAFNHLLVIVNSLGITYLILGLFHADMPSYMFLLAQEIFDGGF